MSDIAANASVEDAVNGIGNAAQNLGSAAQNVAQNAAQSAASVFEDVAAPAPSSAGMFGSGMFGSINTIFARIAFFFLLLVCFYFLGTLGIAFLGWYTRPDKSPYLIKGRLNGTSSVNIVQDPAKTHAVLVSRSNNADTGAEFSWSVWLFLKPQPKTTGATTDAEIKYSTIFYKGNATSPNVDTNITSSNGPGMYVRTLMSGACELCIAMDTTTRHVPDWISVPNMPLEKWVHVLVRLENMKLQVYVNAAVAISHTLSAVPRQNYYDVHVCPNGGFVGELSNLRYFDHAVSAVNMRALLATGPNTAASTAATDASKAGGSYSYLSDNWYL